MMIGHSWAWKIGWCLITIVMGAIFCIRVMGAIFCISQGWFLGSFIETIYMWRFLLLPVGIGIAFAGIIQDPRIVVGIMIAAAIGVWLLFP
jgi:hypothetical protein